MTPMIETCEVENHCPGKPILPLGCYKYEEVSGIDRFYNLKEKNTATLVSSYHFEHVGNVDISSSRPCFPQSFHQRGLTHCDCVTVCNFMPRPYFTRSHLSPMEAINL